MNNKKSFHFSIKSYNHWVGGDELNNIDIITFKFQEEDAYFYTSEHDGQYSGFDSFWKIQHEGNDAKIWKKIFELDKLEYICLNDTNDDVESEYQGEIEDDETEDGKYEDIIDYARKNIKSRDVLIVEFCQKYMSSLDDYDDYEGRFDNSFFMLKALVNIYVKYPSFYEENISIDDEIWDILEVKLGKIEAITKYRADKLNEKLIEKDRKVKEKKKI